MLWQLGYDVVFEIPTLTVQYTILTNHFLFCQETGISCWDRLLFSSESMHTLTFSFKMYKRNIGKNGRHWNIKEMARQEILLIKAPVSLDNKMVVA